MCSEFTNPDDLGLQARIEDAIAEQYGCSDDDDEPRAWPALSASSGAAWWEVAILRQLASDHCQHLDPDPEQPAHCCLWDEPCDTRIIGREP